MLLSRAPDAPGFGREDKLQLGTRANFVPAELRFMARLPCVRAPFLKAYLGIYAILIPVFLIFIFKRNKF